MLFEWPFQVLTLVGLAAFLIVARFGGKRKRGMQLIAGIIWLILLVWLITAGLANLRRSMAFSTRRLPRRRRWYRIVDVSAIHGANWSFYQPTLQISRLLNLEYSGLMQKTGRKFSCHAQADAADPGNCGSLSPEQRMDILLDMINFQQSGNEYSQRLAQLWNWQTQPALGISSWVDLRLPLFANRPARISI